MTPRNQTISLIGGLALVLLIVTFLLYAETSGRSLGAILPTILGFATPVIVTLLASAGIRVEMNTLQRKVNGNYDQLAERNEELARQLAAVHEQFTAQTGAIPRVPPPPPYTGGRHHRPEGAQ